MKTTTRINPLVLIVLLAVGGLALGTGYFLLWQIVLIALPLIMAGILWVYIGINNVEIVPASLPERAQRGEFLEVAIRIKNNSGLPKFMMKIVQAGSMPGYDLRLALNLPAKTTHLWRAGVTCQRRGWFFISPTSLEISDPFGIFSRRKYFGKLQGVLVFPSVKELVLTPLAASSSLPGHNRWFNSRSGGDIYRVREYTEGDTLNHIHWRSTAHTGQLMVKDFHGERVRNVWIVVDMSRDSTQGDFNGDMVEERISVAASLVKYYAAKGYPVGLLSEGDKSLVIKSHPGEKHYWYIMEALATLKAEGQKLVDDIVADEYHRLKNGPLVFLVTSNLNQPLLQRIRHLNSSGTQAAFVIPSGAGWKNQTSHDEWHDLAAYNIPAFMAA